MPDTETTQQDDVALKDAERRVKEAERRVKEFEAAEKKRASDAEAAREAAKVKDLDEARKALESVTAREAEANKRLAEYENRERQRIDTMLNALPEDVKARVEKYKDKLSLSDWSDFVSEEHGRLGPGANVAPTASDEYPPPVSPGGRKTGGSNLRQLHPKSEEILEKLGQDTTAVRELMDVERDPGDKWKAKHIYSPQKLVRAMRERALQPTTLNQENLQKVINAGKLHK